MSTTTPIEVPESRFTAALYEPFLFLAEKLGMTARRTQLLSGARGAVHEIGAAPGLTRRNSPSTLTALALGEPGGPMADPIALSPAPDGVPTRLIRAPAEQ